MTNKHFDKQSISALEQNIVDTTWFIVAHLFTALLVAACAKSVLQFQFREVKEFQVIRTLHKCRKSFMYIR